MEFTMEQPLLALTLHSMDNSIDVGDLWTVFTRCKDSLQYGRRLENMSWRLWYRQTSLGNLTLQKSSQITENSVESPVASFKEIVSTFGSSKDQLVPSKPASPVDHHQHLTQVETPAPSFQERPPRIQGKFFIPSDSETSDSEAEEIATHHRQHRRRHRKRRPSRPETPRMSEWDSDYRCSDSSSTDSGSTLASPSDFTEPLSSYFAKKPQPTTPCPQRSLLSSMLANNPSPEPPRFLRRSRAPVYQDLNQLADCHGPGQQQDSYLSESLKRNILRENTAAGYSRKPKLPRVVESDTFAPGWSDLSLEGGRW
ncbi:hypothetical protein BGW37DRAFT_479140 [Umbelopsis sp. PMI_123]|nr:hypothetical protein BGW37DRAFT_479140 [Umbelopsis sp. PMI_123]